MYKQMLSAFLSFSLLAGMLSVPVFASESVDAGIQASLEEYSPAESDSAAGSGTGAVSSLQGEVSDGQEVPISFPVLRGYRKANGITVLGFHIKPESKDAGETAAAVLTPAVEHGSYTVSDSMAEAGAQVDINLKPDDWYLVGSVAVTDAQGEPVAVEPGQGSAYCFEMPEAGRQPVTVHVEFFRVEEEHLCPCESYYDVNQKLWYHDAVDYMVEHQYMVGIGPDQFAPIQVVTRAALAAILYGMEGKPACGGASFSDVPADAWYAQPAAWAAEKGIMSGYGDGRFGPGDSLTREQLAAVLYAYAAFRGLDVTGTADLSSYADGDAVSTWAKDAIGWAAAEGLIAVDESNHLVPQGIASRAQAASVFFQLHNRYPDNF